MSPLLDKILHDDFLNISNIDDYGVLGKNFWLYIPNNEYSKLISSIQEIKESCIVYSIDGRVIMQTPSSLMYIIDDEYTKIKIKLFQKEISDVIKQAFIKFRTEIKDIYEL